MLATSFAEAAGVSGRQKWGLVLSSSARVSQVTYQTVVGVRYPELVTYNGTQWKFGKYVQQESPLPGGFLPIFWDVPRANIHAVEDIGAVVDWLLERSDFQPDAKSNLAVLHNRNDMTNLFRASNWVSSSNDSIVSRGVTTCAGMTAHTVLLAQTKVGFLTGGRKKSFRLLSEDEQMVQLEESYARATVAITMPFRDYQRGEVATLSLSSQWIVFGGLVCRGLWLTNCLAGGLHDGAWSSSQGRWLWLSRLEEKVWC